VLSLGPLSLVSTTEELLGRKVAAPVYKAENTAVGIRRTDYATPLYPQKLALTSPTSCGRSVGIVRSRTKATVLLLLLECCLDTTISRISKEYQVHYAVAMVGLLQKCTVVRSCELSPRLRVVLMYLWTKYLVLIFPYCGPVVVNANRKVAGSIPDEVIFKFT
jgi:hypothetical protein